MADGAHWHSIAQEPLTRTPVSSIKINIYPLDDQEETWYTMHEKHADRGDSTCIFRCFAGVGYLYVVDDEDLDAEIFDMIKWCGRDASTNLEPLVVPALEKSYVTIPGVMTTVHPWLMTHR